MICLSFSQFVGMGIHSYLQQLKVSVLKVHVNHRMVYHCCWMFFSFTVCMQRWVHASHTQLNAAIVVVSQHLTII